MKKILLIEDEGAMQKILRKVLEERGHEVVSAFDGEAGVAAAQTQTPDAIIVDLILPKKDGFGVLKALKENASTSGIPAVVLTNLEGVGDVEQALELGATTYLVKANYTAEEIVARVEEIIAK